MNNNQQQKLLALGAILFFLGLLSGVVIPLMTNPRMGVSSHLEGVMNGTFLIAVGMAWGKLYLSCRAKTIAYWLLIYGAYANWVTVQIAAVFGTKAMSPIAGAGYQGLPWQETMITVGLASVGVTMIIAAVLLIWGFASMSNDENS